MPCYLKPSPDTTQYFVSLSSRPFSLSLSLSLSSCRNLSLAVSHSPQSLPLYLFHFISFAAALRLVSLLSTSHSLSLILFYFTYLPLFLSPPFFSPFFSFLLCLKTFYLPACLVSCFPLSIYDSLHRCKNISKLLLFEIRTEKLFI